MRFISRWVACLLLLGVALSASASAVRKEEVMGRDVVVEHLISRQQSSLAAIINGTGSTTGSDSDSSSSSSATSSATNTTTSTGAKCEMLGQITNNQQVSWSGKYIQACCTSSIEAVCFIRSNDDGSGSSTTKADPAACFQVPSCPTLLQGGDASTMAGFRPLNSTWGTGAEKNHYKFSFAASIDGATVSIHGTSSAMAAITSAGLASIILALAL